MRTRLFPPGGVNAAAAVVRRGGLVVFPTETVFGLGASAYDEGACRRIFRAKGRPQDNPLIVHLADPGDIDQAAASLPGAAAGLVERFMPGPLTLILPANDRISRVVTAGRKNVGIRVPALRLARDFLAACAVPVAAPSANRSGEPSPTTLSMARAAMEGRVEAILEGPDAEVGLESTVVRLAGPRLEILRPGAVTSEALAEAAPDLEVVAVDGGDDTPESPGRKYAHYRPRARVLLIRDRETLRGEASAAIRGRIGLVSFFEPAPGDLPSAEILHRRVGDDVDYARRLFAAFDEFDRLGCDIILAEWPTAGGLAEAIRNRLLKASGGAFLD